MVMRTTLKDTARRAQTSLARATIREVDDDHYWQEATADVMTSETHSGFERCQQYGFTCVPMKQSEEEGGQKKQGQQGGGSGGGGGQGQGEQGEQPKGDSAEAMIAYVNGSRSHPVALGIDDRRYRMMNAKAGDVALYDHQQQQLHFNKDGAYLTSLSDKTIKLQLADKGGYGKPKKDPDAPQGGEQKEKKWGQQPRYDKKSTKFVDVTPEVTRAFGKRSQLGLEDGNGYVDCTPDKKVWLGIEKGKGQHALVLTEDGPAENVYAKLGGGPLPKMGGGSINETELPRRCFYAATHEVDALALRIDMLEQHNAQLLLLVQKLLTRS